ncbi:unnamed protein product [Cuscuta epithymum]|uniref:DUF7787 domain-containing protein n=1 Tax=Cuscuta epithymum TaxID=186058 RepID=A0AAV0CGR2_9ASTE|nr:unnamed protein product [Cuscuta epithymum]
MAESGIGRRARGKLTVDEYLNFIDTNRQLDLTAPQLREIIDMHGFKAMRSASKRVGGCGFNGAHTAWAFNPAARDEGELESCCCGGYEECETGPCCSEMGGVLRYLAPHHHLLRFPSNSQFQL